MSAAHGRGGSVSWGSPLSHLDAYVHTWSLDYSADDAEVTVFGSPTDSAPYPRQYIAGLTEWSGSYEAYLDSTSTLVASDIGVTATITLDTGNQTYSGSAFITGWSPSVSVDGVETVTVSFRGTGVLSIT